MKQFRRMKAGLSLLLSVVLTFTVMAPITVSAVNVDTSKLGSDLYLTSKTNYVIAPGVTEAQITTNNKTGTNQAAGFAMEVDLSNPSTSIIASYKNYDATSWGMQTVRDQAAAAEKKLGVNVVAGVNADLFNMQTGAPIGTFVMNSTVYNVNNGTPYFAILKDGTAKIGKNATNAEIANFKESVSGPAVILKNGVIDASNSYGASQMPRTAVGIKADGSVIFFVADGRQAPVSCGMDFDQLARTMLALGCVDALSLDGGGSSTFLSRHEGSDELVCRNSPSDGSERVVSTAMLVTSSAKPTGVFDHATLSPNNELYTPNSSVDFTASGVDSSGSAVELPADGTFALADSSFGSISADGKFVSNGKTGTVTVNYMSGGSVCGSVSIEIVVPDDLYLPKNEFSLGFEETTDFDIEAKYQNRTVNMKAGDLQWQLLDESGNDIAASAGTFDGLTFTTLDGVTVTGFVTATCTYNTSLSVSLKAVIGAMPVVMYDFEYTTDKAEADASDGALKYIPTYDMPRFDRSTGVSSAAQAEVFRQQGYPLYNWPNASLTDQNSMKSRIVSKDDGEPVRFGEHSYRIDYDYSSYNGSSNSNNYVRVTDQNYFFEGSPTAIGCWVYVPEGTANFALYLNCCNKNTSASYMPVTGVTTGIDWTGWKYVEFDLTDTTLAANAGSANAPFGFYQGCGVFWISYQVGKNLGDRTASTIYLDNIQLVYGANTDDIDNPVISSVRTDATEIKDGETVFNSNVNTFKAAYADFDGKYATGIDFGEVKMLIDGVDVTDKCFINEGDEEIYFYDAYLANGIHNIEISVADKFGNVTTDTRYFTINGTDTNTEVSFSAVDEAPVLGSQYTLAITSNNAADIVSADIDVRILSNFTQYWDDYTVVPNANYTLESTPTYDSTTATISFKAVRNADADASADNGTIANIVFDIPSNVPEGLEVTYRIAKGDLTYTTTQSDKYISSFSGKIKTTCVSPFTLTPDTMLAGTAGGNIKVTDTDGTPIADVNIYTQAGQLLGVTDAQGVLFTNAFTGSVMQYSIYAEKDGKLSFIYNGQSFPSGGSADGMPSYIKLNASVDSDTQENISWMANPTASKDGAVVLYAEKSEYDANGDAAFTTFTGTSYISEMPSSASYTTNYAVRLNGALITGLKPGTEYVYKVGDGEKMSALKSFSTTRKGTAVNFFVIGDTQATDTTNTDKITENLAASGVDYAFGIQTGDAVDNGGNYTMWENIAKVFSGDFLGSKDLVQVLGNHEYYGDVKGSSASAYFNLPGTENGTAPLCYSVQYGNIYVAVINYSDDAGYAKAAEWLKTNAAASTATWKVLSMHQPAYYTNPSGNSEEVAQMLRNAVDEAGIDFVFSGHDHSYARTAPMTAGQIDNTNGAVYYICGSTGEKSYEIVNNASFNFKCLDGSYNAIYLTVSTTDTEFVVTTHEYTEDGQDVIIDSYTMTKEVTCTADGHDYEYADGFLTCSVCGFTVSADSYTGFAKDKATGGLMYIIAGEPVTGWYSLGTDNYYFDENGIAQTGKITLDGHTYTFGEDGKMEKGSMEKNSDGTYSYYINGTAQRGWFFIDGYWYYFSRTNGYKTLKGTAKVNNMTYQFANSGKLLVGAWNKTDTGTSYYWGPDPVTGLQEIEGYKYYFNPTNTYMIVNDSVEIDGTVYAFGTDGKFVHNGEHVDANNDGTCDLCKAASYSFMSFWQKIINFFKRIILIFQKNFG